MEVASMGRITGGMGARTAPFKSLTTDRAVEDRTVDRADTAARTGLGGVATSAIVTPVLAWLCLFFFLLNCPVTSGVIVSSFAFDQDWRRLSPATELLACHEQRGDHFPIPQSPHRRLSAPSCVCSVRRCCSARCRKPPLHCRR